METIANPFSLEGDMPCCIDYDDRPREGGVCGQTAELLQRKPGADCVKFPCCLIGFDAANRTREM